MRLYFFLTPEQGYYRAARFDWSGLVACVSLNGHTFFGEWFNRYDPMTNDAVTGPAEEFREPIGYEDAKPGDPFVKLGVGVVKRVERSALYDRRRVPDSGPREVDGQGS